MALRNDDWGPLGRNSKDKLRLGSRPYKTYTALLSQESTGTPIATVLENTLSGPVVWTRASEGVYEGTLADEFVDGKTVVIALTPHMLGLTPTGESLVFRASANAVQVQSYSDRFSTLADTLLENFPIEIRVYN